jgi:hypothetical protein
MGRHHRYSARAVLIPANTRHCAARSGREFGPGVGYIAVTVRTAFVPCAFIPLR